MKNGVGGWPLLAAVAVVTLSVSATGVCVAVRVAMPFVVTLGCCPSHTLPSCCPLSALPLADPPPPPPLAAPSGHEPLSSPEIGGIPGMAEFIDNGGGPLDRFTTRSTAPPGMFSGDGVAGGRGLGAPSLCSLPGSGDPGSNLSAGGSSFPAAASAGTSSPFDGGGPGSRQQHQVAAGGGGGGQPAEMEMDMSAYDGKDLDWSVFSASPSMFNISGGGSGGGGGGSGGPDGTSVGPQSQSSRSQQGSPGAGGGGRGRDLPHQHQLSGLPPPSSGRPILGKDGSGDNANGGGLDVNTQSHGSRSSSLGGGGGGSCGVLGLNSGSRTGSFSSAGTGTPPLAGRSMATAPWNIMGGPPVRSIDGGGGGGAPPRAAENSPRAGMPVAGTLAGMKKLSITSDDSNSGVRDGVVVQCFVSRRFGGSVFQVLFFAGCPPSSLNSWWMVVTPCGSLKACSPSHMPPGPGWIVACTRKTCFWCVYSRSLPAGEMRGCGVPSRFHRYV